MSDILELFSRDPLTFTKEGGEVRMIVEKLRESRAQYKLGAIKAGNLKPKKTASAKAAANITGLSLNLQALIGGNK